MKIEQIQVPGLAQYSYIVSSEGRAAVIDPIRDIERYVAAAAEQKLTITHVLETHIHADFASGGRALADRTGAPLCVSGYDKGEQYVYSMPHRSLLDGDRIDVGRLQLQVLHTPGHTPEHISFVLYDLSRSGDVPVALFSGDFLFVGSMGRPDLLGEDAKLGLAHELYRSAHTRLRALPDSVQLYPGHGAGSLCGSGMSDRAESTLGYERAVNPLFRLDEAAFVNEILRTVPEMPTYYPRMKSLNSAGAQALPETNGGRGLDLEEFESLIRQRNVTLLDIRTAEAYGGAHIPGSVNIGAGHTLSLWAGWLLDPEKRIILISDQADDPETRLGLMRVGLDRIEGYLLNGFSGWRDAGRPLAHVPQRSVEEVREAAGDALVLDVRSSAEWLAGHISEAAHIMLGDLEKRLGELPRDRELVTVCGSGYRASIASSLLLRAGFHRVSNMDGGMGAWMRCNYPVANETA